jgi:SAM-dependent methyltransferase
MNAGIQQVRDFWNENPCGSKTVDAPIMSREFFLDYERKRYESEPYIRKLLAADDVKDKRVVEIGCGMGTDGVQLARAGGRYLGVDLTPMGARLTQTNLQQRGLAGAAINASAEQLPLADSSVDFIYSHGVLHHTPDIDRAVAEVRRVLRPGGRIHLMLYHRHSYNFYVSILVLRRLGAVLLRMPGGLGLVHRLTGESLENLEVHRARLCAEGFRYLFGADWLNRNTDGALNPLARVYTRKSARDLLAGFSDFQFRVANINKRHLPIVGRLLPRSLEQWLGRTMGWHLHIFAVRTP